MVSALVQRSAPTGLLEKLMAQVRAEFRVGIYVADPDDLVLGRRPCTVAGCDRSRTAFGLCSGHDQRWRTRGCPDLAEFNADPGPTINGRRELTHCTVPGCRYGSSGFGLCTRHRLVWLREGQPDPKPWAAQAPIVGPSSIAECSLPFCSVWTENANHQFCKSHETRWAQLGRPDAEEYIAHCLRSGKAQIDFRGMAPQLTLELQYAVQCRHDQATITAPPSVVAWTIALARRAEVSSLLDLPPQRWHELAGSKPGMYQRFLEYARDAVETLHEGTSWEVEYPRDVWRMHRLPGLTLNAGKTPHPRVNLRFDRFTQPWLRTLVKRWARLRLSSGLAVATVLCDIQGLARFSAFLAEAAPDVKALGGIDRAVLERYLAWLITSSLGHGAREDAVTSPTTFFQAIRQHGWDDTLAATALFFPGDLPSRPPRLTRRLAEYVMAQVEAPANLDRWTTPEGRLITIILIRCGLRATDACTLAFDCLLHDGQNAPYLRYFNNKMRREAAVPIDEDLEGEIRAQQRRVAARWPQQHRHLFPAINGNAGGHHPVTYYSYRGMLNYWLTSCDVRDEHGQLAALTPHQWRHTFAGASRIRHSDSWRPETRVELPVCVGFARVTLITRSHLMQDMPIHWRWGLCCDRLDWRALRAPSSLMAYGSCDRRRRWWRRCCGAGVRSRSRAGCGPRPSTRGRRWCIGSWRSPTSSRGSGDRGTWTSGR